jgi:type I restriction enzyme R subunit
MDGKVINAQEFITRLYGELTNFFKSEEELRTLWSDSRTREKLLDGLAGKGFPLDKLKELRIAIDSEKCDIYDVLAYIKFASPQKLRQERADSVRTTYKKRLTETQDEFLEYILNQYIDNDFTVLSQDNLPKLVKIY